jgi:hypothetical protein
MIWIRPFKEKEKEGMKEDPNWVTNGRFQCLVANGRRRRSTFSPLPTFPQVILLKLSFFPLILRFYFTMVLGCYLHISSLFFDLLITTTHLDVTSPSHIHCQFDFDWRFFLFSLKLWCRIWPCFTGLNPHKWMKNQL